MSKADIKQHDYRVFKHLGQGTFFELLIMFHLIIIRIWIHHLKNTVHEISIAKVIM